MDDTFINSPVIKNHEQRIQSLEVDAGALLPQDWFNTIQNLRDYVSYADADRAGCYANESVYQFVANDLTPDNGDTVLMPADIASMEPGRWLSEKRFALNTHTHSTLISKPALAAENNLAAFDAAKGVKDSGKKAVDFVLKELNKGLSTNDYTTDEKNKLAALLTAEQFSQAFSAFIPKILNVVLGEVGDVVVLTAEGYITKSGEKMPSIRRATATINAGVQTIAFSTAMPNTNYTVFLLAKEGKAIGDAYDLSTTGFKVEVLEASTTIMYLAINN